MTSPSLTSFLFFFNDTATTEIYTLSLHDALPIYRPGRTKSRPPNATDGPPRYALRWPRQPPGSEPDRKSRRLNSSHQIISYAVFCLKKKKKKRIKKPNKKRRKRQAHCTRRKDWLY